MRVLVPLFPPTGSRLQGMFARQACEQAALLGLPHLVTTDSDDIARYAEAAGLSVAKIDSPRHDNGIPAPRGTEDSIRHILDHSLFPIDEAVCIVNFQNPYLDAALIRKACNKQAAEGTAIVSVTMPRDHPSQIRVARKSSGVEVVALRNGRTDRSLPLPLPPSLRCPARGIPRAAKKVGLDTRQHTIVFDESARETRPLYEYDSHAGLTGTWGPGNLPEEIQGFSLFSSARDNKSLLRTSDGGRLDYYAHEGSLAEGLSLEPAWLTHSGELRPLPGARPDRSSTMKTLTIDGRRYMGPLFSCQRPDDAAALVIIGSTPAANGTHNYTIGHPVHVKMAMSGEVSPTASVNGRQDFAPVYCPDGSLVIAEPSDWKRMQSLLAGGKVRGFELTGKAALFAYHPDHGMLLAANEKGSHA